MTYPPGGLILEAAPQSASGPTAHPPAASGGSPDGVDAASTVANRVLPDGALVDDVVVRPSPADGALPADSAASADGHSPADDHSPADAADAGALHDGAHGPDADHAAKALGHAVQAPVWRPDAAEREQLVERYSHLVKYVVGRLGVSVSGVFDRDDAMQAGVIGLIQAIDGYRPGTGASFESYALVRIRGAILDAVRALDSVGRAGREAARAIERAMSELAANLGRPPEEREIADKLGIPLERYQDRLRVASMVTVSLDEPDDHGGGTDGDDLADGVADENALDPAQVSLKRDEVAQLALAVSGLGERQKMVLSLYYQEELTLREIGEVLGVTESRVCQIHTETLLALRVKLGAGKLPGVRRSGGRPRGGGPAGGDPHARASGRAEAGDGSVPAVAPGATTSGGPVGRPCGTPMFRPAYRPAVPAALESRSTARWSA